MLGKYFSTYFVATGRDLENDAAFRFVVVPQIQQYNSCSARQTFINFVVNMTIFRKNIHFCLLFEQDFLIKKNIFFAENAGCLGYKMSTFLLDRKIILLLLYLSHKALPHVKNRVK